MWTRTRRAARGRLPVPAAATAAALAAGIALGAPADLDRGFGRDGRATIGSGAGGDTAHGIAIQPDGGIVLAGQAGSDPAAFRLNPDGSPDRGFDGDGSRVVDLGTGYGGAHGVAVQPDGRIVLAGYVSTGLDGAVLRLNRDGSTDPAFDGDGLATIDSGGAERLHGVAVQPDGGIVVTGFTTVGRDAAVYRLTPAGRLDAGFDGDGARGLDLGDSAIAQGVAVQPDGRIVIAGWTTTGDDTDAFVARFTGTGLPDPAFGGGDGVTQIETGADDDVNAVAVQPDGRIVVAGGTSLNDDATVFRLTAGGALDQTFGVGGIARLAGPGNEHAFALALDGDGRILVGGTTEAGYDAVVHRLRPDGSRDPSFGNGGTLVYGGGGLEAAAAVAVQPDGGILLGGDDSASDQDVLVVRLRGGTDPATGPGTGGGPGPAAVPGPAPSPGPAGRPSPPAPRCAGRTATIVGTPRADRIRGTSRADVIAGLGGDDVVRGLAGDDVVCGGAGDDVVIGGAGRDTLLGQAGRDRLAGGPGRDRLVGGPGRDRLDGRLEGPARPRR